jgi:hypothetical protein
MSETLEQMEARHAAEKRALLFVQADADAGKAATETHIATTTKTAAFGVAVGTETIDSQYVTLTTPTDKEGVDAALWSLIVNSLCNDDDCKCIVGAGTIRVRKDRAATVLDKIEAALPEVAAVL